MAVGMLEFDGEKVDLANYKKLLDQYRPKGRNKRAIVKNLRFKPLKVAGDVRQGMINTGGGTRQELCEDAVSFPVFNEDAKKYDYKEGTLRYYERKQPNQKMTGGFKYTPDRITFTNGFLEIGATNDALLLFWVCSSKNKANSLKINEEGKEVGWSNVPGSVEIILPTAGAKKLGVEMDEKLKAMKAVDLALASNLPLARQLYQSLGYTDWDVYVDAKGKGEFAEIRAVLMGKADKDPGKVLELLSDTALDITSKIVQAVTLGVLLQEGDMLLWGPAANDGKYKNVPSKEKLIARVPKGKGATKEAALEWFCEFLKGEPGVMSEINVELNEIRLKEAA